MQKKLNVKIKRLKSGGFVSSGTDAGDLQILRTAKNIDDGSGMKSGGYVKKMKKGKKIKVKKIPAVPMDDSLRFDKGITRGSNPSAFIEGTRVPFGRSPTIDRMKKGGKVKKKITPIQRDKYKASLAYQIKTGRTNKKKGEDLVDKIKKGYEFTTKTAPRRAARVAAGDPIAKRKYGAGDVFNQFTEKATRMKEGGKTKSYTGKIIKPPKDYKAKIRNLADPNVSSEESYDAMMKRYDKEDMQKSRYGRALKENEIEVKKGGILKIKKGGKAKSRVNEAGNYTKPGLRKSIFNRIKAGGKGGRPGQWSARKAQMMAKAYKKAGGGYK